MSTTLLYLENTYLEKADTTFLRVVQTEKGEALVLDATIFYPQGGGQPSDKGYISSPTGTFEVTDVRLDAEGTVLHFGTFTNGYFTESDQVSLVIDISRRIMHARIHSGGHLVDSAVRTLFPELKAHKGFHFTEGPYIEGVGLFEGESELVKGLIEKTTNELVGAALPIVAKSLDDSQASALGLVAPAGKTVRIVSIGDFPPVGCGGTHVRNTQEIGVVVIRKVTSKGGVFKVAYEVLD